ncbi:nitrite reductase (NAD(P)H) small subunit [Aeromonas media]|uniref:nitrite reductase (NAD(P)H) small subunit n=1 Tax=Aeromonas media TaxID=651 RepID=UPI003CFF154F
MLGRGLVGDAGGEPVVASPLYKQRYALMDGRCLDDPALSVACWPVRLEGGAVWVQLG